MANSPPPAPRWTAHLSAFFAGVGAIISVAGLLFTIGSWRSRVDERLDQLGKRMDQAEANDKTYIPVLIGMTRDVSYLADRARREDERQSRERK